MFQKLTKALIQYYPMNFYRRNLRTSLINMKLKNTDTFDYPFIKDKEIENYLKKVEVELNKSPHGTTNAIENSQILRLFVERRRLIKNINVLEDGKHELNLDTSEQSAQWLALLNEEQKKYEMKLEDLTMKIIDCLLVDEFEVNSLVFEVKSGVGGKEAMLFTKSLFQMYLNYIEYKKWNAKIIDKSGTELGGLRHGSIQINGVEAMKHLRHESGVHRVQRVPQTERSGRLHTSTATVAILPQPDQCEWVVNNKDLIVETYRSNGPGGQHVNKTESAVRITHVPSGIIVECQEDRSQIKNKKIAMQKLRAKLYEHSMTRQEEEMRTSRKFQVGCSSRSDKVRTYNFAQDRITDHRLNENFSNVEKVLQGHAQLDQINNKLVIASRRRDIAYFFFKMRI